MTDCRDNCDIPKGGFCVRHNIKKPLPWVQLCQKHGSYWQAWEEGRGPGQLTGGTARIIARSKNTPVVAGGPGTELKKLLSWFGIKATGRCKCNNRARVMDNWGPQKCREKMDTILIWLEEEAAARKLPFWKFAAKIAVETAIARAKKKVL